MTRSSDEGVESGLGWFDAETRRMEFDDIPGKWPLPNMGWRDVRHRDGYPLMQGYKSTPRFYFVHSYYMKPDGPELASVTSSYGFDFACGLSRNNLHCVQFHPEKSHSFGMRFLPEFRGASGLMRSRVIPVLLLKNAGLYKTRKFRDEVYIGDPINAVRIFNEKEVDELAFLSIEAARSGGDPDLEVLKNIAGECFMPLAYGGGVKSEQRWCAKFWRSASRRSSSTRPHGRIRPCSDPDGAFRPASTIVGSIDVKRSWTGREQVMNSWRPGKGREFPRRVGARARAPRRRGDHDQCHRPRRGNDRI